MQDITDCGGHVLFSTTVAEISELGTDDGSKGYRTSCILTNSTRYVIDSRYLIFTGSCRTFVNVSHGLPIPIDLRDIMMNVTYKAGLSVMLVSKKPFSSTPWLMEQVEVCQYNLKMILGLNDAAFEATVEDWSLGRADISGPDGVPDGVIDDYDDVTVDLPANL